MPRGNWMESQCPTLGMESLGKRPTIAPGGGGWALLELTDALQQLAEITARQYQHRH